MKYIRLYEGKKNSLQVGDYVVCDETLSNNFTLGSEVNIFLSNNVGQYIIDYFSSNKEDCEAYLASKKYNI